MTHPSCHSVSTSRDVITVWKDQGDDERVLSLPVQNVHTKITHRAINMKTLLLLFVFIGGSLSARILGINPTESISHQKPFLIIMRALAEKGHDVTIITTHPLKDPPKNLTQIDVSLKYPKHDMKNMMTVLLNTPAEKLMESLLPMNEYLFDTHINNPEIQQLLKSTEKFDVVIVETVMHWSYFGFIHKLGYPPVIGFVSVGLAGVMNSFVGNPINPAYMPDVLYAYTNKMNFWERLHNTYSLLKSAHSFYTAVLPYNDRIIQRHFGTDVPSLNEMIYNMTLIITSSHFCINYPQPNLPNVIETTGLHVETKRNPLPKEIQKFLDGAEHGVIYFSLGSNMRSSFLPQATINSLLGAFSELKERILWKFEEDELTGKPDNVMIVKWLPQQDILAHRNIRLFITQGGLQSFNEAAYFGVPLIGIPCFGDQAYDVAKMVSAGIGEKLGLQEITTETALRTIRHVLDNPSFRENMKQFSAVYREHQETSLERAVWWVEYVIRHKGARHLRSAALDLRWWQLLLLDVGAFILAVVAVGTFLLYKSVLYLTTLLRRRNKQKKS